MFDASSLANMERTDVAFFSKGAGRGHAMPDMAIADSLGGLIGDVQVKFISYGTGASTFRSNGRSVIDLHMPDNNPFFDTFVHCIQVVERLRPVLVVTHEEVAPLLAAKAFGIPSVFITDFFQDPSMLVNKLLEYAAEIVFMGEPGVFTEPPNIRDRVCYVGPAVRPLGYRKKDKRKARSEMQLPENGIIVSCLPGSWRENGDPIADLIYSAFVALPDEAKCLVWVASRDCDVLSHKFGNRTDIRVVAEDWKLDRLMVSSDVAITKGSRTTLQELCSLGIPSIAISRGLNWPDDVAAARIPTNQLVRIHELTSARLCELLQQQIAASTGFPGDTEWPKGVEATARRIAEHLAAVMADRHYMCHSSDGC